ncbi:DUF4347 domain-containing protein, partial [Anabaena sp. PCC 7938]|uniref:DUF4347 domain-containing protein n=1 Tax=Anabaena sp. PCC 7938 TaxID=1296340 RepID=UPI001D9A4DF0
MTINNIVFIDSTVNDYQTLASQAKTGTEVIVLDNSKDGVSQITQALAGRSNLDSIQIFSHGAEGAVYLGSAVLDSQSLEGYQVQLQQWGEALGDNGDILVYGCNVATGEGQAFVEQLSEITGADVAASNDLTGNAALGGDWELEIETGLIEANIGINENAIANYDGLLDIIKVTNTNDNDTGSLRWAIEQATSQKFGFDVIDLRDVSGTISLNSSLPTIAGGNNLFWVGDGDITINGRGQYQIITYSVNNSFGEVLGIQGVNFTQGLARGGDGNGGGGGGLGAGGAIFVDAGRLVLDNVSFNANEAIGGSSYGRAGSGFRGDGDDGSGGDGGDGGKLNVTGDQSLSNPNSPGSGGSGDSGNGGNGGSG